MLRQFYIIKILLYPITFLILLCFFYPPLFGKKYDHAKRPYKAQAATEIVITVNEQVYKEKYKREENPHELKPCGTKRS